MAFCISVRRGLWAALLGLFLGLGITGGAQAVQPDEILDDPKLEQRARGLSGELRCLVCQNQSIDDFDAPLARDLRLIVRERLKAGDSDEDVRDFMVARYGEFVLLRPRFSPRNALLWAAPFIVLVLGGLAIVVFARRRDVSTAPPLSRDEEDQLNKLLKETAATDDGGRKG